MTDQTKTGPIEAPDDAAKQPIGRWIGFGIGAGIGSAAIAAALLYANGARKKPERHQG